ncbi:hypothetical protein [Sulfuracidifex metallicus]|uniref:hypothetical protein n=1 Tax=Sulfuracidifex metallicus TaxID=47303 RepID=UPI0006D12842|nr:hypothetical protein [Sulfuracidifex metallicus]
MEVIPRKGYTIDELANSMTEEEYRKAKEFYKFLVNITKCTQGILSIERKKLIDIAAAYMECTPIEAHNILMKMKTYRWIKTLDKDYIIVDLEKKI